MENKKILLIAFSAITAIGSGALLKSEKFNEFFSNPCESEESLNAIKDIISQNMLTMTETPCMKEYCDYSIDISGVKSVKSDNKFYKECTGSAKVSASVNRSKLAQFLSTASNLKYDVTMYTLSGGKISNPQVTAYLSLLSTGFESSETMLSLSYKITDDHVSLNTSVDLNNKSEGIDYKDFLNNISSSGASAENSPQENSERQINSKDSAINYAREIESKLDDDDICQGYLTSLLNGEPTSSGQRANCEIPAQIKPYLN